MEVLQLGQNQAMRKQMMMMKKRSFDETFENCGGATAGSKSPVGLLQWSRQPSDDEEDDNQNNAAVDHQGNVEEKDIIVGWPPISSWRKRHLHDYQGVVNFY